MKRRTQALIAAAIFIFATAGYFLKHGPQRARTSVPRVPAQSVSDPSASAPAAPPAPPTDAVSKPALAPTPPTAVTAPNHQPMAIAPKTNPVLIFEEPTVASDPSVPATKPTPSPAANLKAPPAADDFGGAHIYGGLGMNYYQFSENLNTSNATYRSIMTPSYHLGVDLDLTKRTAVELEYKDTTVHFNNSSVNLNSGNGHWQTLALQVSTQLDGFSNFLSRTFGKSLEFRLLFGFEVHRLPIALFNNSSQPEVKNLDLVDADVGGRTTYYFNPKTKLNIFERIQYPLAVSAEDAGASMSATPIILFDGSVGVDRKVGKETWLGIYWYGQYNDMKFSYTDSQTDANGSMSSFFSTIEVRLTYDFQK